MWTVRMEGGRLACLEGWDWRFFCGRMRRWSKAEALLLVLPLWEGWELLMREL